jgi:DNA-binding SARP family transcriptional activator
MSTIKFFLLGRFRIEVNGFTIERIETRKAEELLAYLLIYRGQPQSREHMADVLWRNITPEQSKSYLRKALWQLQSMLDLHDMQGILLVDGEWLQVNPHFKFWLDIDILEKTFKNIEGAQGKDLKEIHAENIRNVAEIYQGELLQGWYQDWCLYERERLQFLFIAMLEKLMDRFEANKDYENGILIGERILRSDRARERTHRGLMRLFYLSGDRTSSLRQYQKCVAALKEELNVDPADDTRLLFEMISIDNFGLSRQPNRAVKERRNNLEEPLNILFSDLNSLQKSLSQMQIQIAQNIEVIQETLRRNQY